MLIGKVLDSSALVAVAHGDLAAAAWLATANAMAMTFYVPELVFVEALALNPTLEADLEDLRTLPAIVVRAMAERERLTVTELLARSGTFDVLAGQVVHIATARGWPVLTADPARYRRIVNDLEVDELLHPGR